MKGKFICVLLAISMVMSLCACTTQLNDVGDIHSKSQQSLENSGTNTTSSNGQTSKNSTPSISNSNPNSVNSNPNSKNSIPNSKNSIPNSNNSNPNSNNSTPIGSNSTQTSTSGGNRQVLTKKIERIQQSPKLMHIH